MENGSFYGFFNKPLENRILQSSVQEAWAAKQAPLLAISQILQFRLYKVWSIKEQASQLVKFVLVIPGMKAKFLERLLWICQVFWWNSLQHVKNSGAMWWHYYNRGFVY